MYECIFGNLPGDPAWVGSFYERLAEDAEWDRGEFWKLHLALTDAASMAGASTSIDRELARAVTRIHSRVLGLGAAHYDASDVFEIRNLADDELRAFVERFDLAVLGVFSGEVLPESSFDLINPLNRGS